MEKFSIQKSFWHAVVWHPFDVTCPSDLCLACLSANAECTCSAQDCCVWYSVLPSILSTLHRLEVEIIESPLALMSPVEGPGLIGTEKDGQEMSLYTFSFVDCHIPCLSHTLNLSLPYTMHAWEILLLFPY